MLYKKLKMSPNPNVVDGKKYFLKVFEYLIGVHLKQNNNALNVYTCPL